MRCPAADVHCKSNDHLLGHGGGLTGRQVMGDDRYIFPEDPPLTPLTKDARQQLSLNILDVMRTLGEVLRLHLFESVVVLPQDDGHRVGGGEIVLPDTGENIAVKSGVIQHVPVRLQHLGGDHQILAKGFNLDVKIPPRLSRGPLETPDLGFDIILADKPAMDPEIVGTQERRIGDGDTR